MIYSAFSLRTYTIRLIGSFQWMKEESPRDTTMPIIDIGGAVRGVSMTGDGRVGVRKKASTKRGELHDALLMSQSW